MVMTNVWNDRCDSRLQSLDKLVSPNNLREETVEFNIFFFNLARLHLRDLPPLVVESADFCVVLDRLLITEGAIAHQIEDWRIYGKGWPRFSCRVPVSP